MSLLTKCVAGAALATTGAATVSADIVITPGPGNFFGDENVLYNLPTLLDGGPVVQGATNQSHTIVDFSGAGESLVTPSLGQARIEGADGTFTTLTIALHSAQTTFKTLIFNLDVCNRQGDGEVTINVAVDGDGIKSQTFSLDENGQNFFRIAAVDGQEIASVSFASTVQLCDIAQVRIGGIDDAAPPPTPVPLPASAISGGALLVAAAIIRRLRRR